MLNHATRGKLLELLIAGMLPPGWDNNLESLELLGGIDGPLINALLALELRELRAELSELRIAELRRVVREQSGPSVPEVLAVTVRVEALEERVVGLEGQTDAIAKDLEEILARLAADAIPPGQSDG